MTDPRVEKLAEVRPKSLCFWVASVDKLNHLHYNHSEDLCQRIASIPRVIVNEVICQTWLAWKADLMA